MLVFLAACSTVSSKNLRTGGISPTMRVAVRDGGLEVSVTLGAGGVNTVHLDDNDALTASAAGRSVDLDGGTFLGVAGYGGRIAGVDKPGTPVRISLRRGDKDTSAPDSTVRLPQRVAVRAPRPEQRVSRARDLLIEVNDAPGDIRVAWQGSCVQSRTGLPDYPHGQPVVVSAGTIPRAGKHGPSSCLMTLTVSRVVHGTLDGAYDGGDISAVRSVSLAVRSVP